MCNIYLESSGEFYYADSQKSRSDKLIDKNVSHDYAFMFCAAKNFNQEFKAGVKKKAPSRNYKFVSEKQLKFRNEVNQKMHILLSR